MTLHEAIAKLLQQAGKPMSTQDIAEKLNKNKWYKKGDGSPLQASQIHLRTRRYPNLFSRNGATVSLTGQTLKKSEKNGIKAMPHKNRKSSSNSKDECYVLDLCDKVLALRSSRQHRFDFLQGDRNAKGIAVKLPVDGYYEELNLVIEYRERQHTESVAFFDKINRMTVSKVHRGEQRKIYDERRRTVLPQHNIKLIEFSFTDFNYDSRKRILRNPIHDEDVIRKKLKETRLLK